MGLGKTALALSTKALPESKKKLAVAEYYSSLRRLSDGVERSLQNITAIDVMIGEGPLLTDISCNSFDPLSGEVKSQCRSVKQCSNNKANDQNSSSSKNAVLEESAKDTLLALQAIEAIDKEIKRIKFMANPVSFEGSGGVSGTSKKKIEELEERKKNLQNLYPWIVGKVFKDGYKARDYASWTNEESPENRNFENQIAGLIKDQLTHTREKLKERKEDFIKASFCIKGDEDLCDQLDMAKVLAKTPPINHDEVFERDRKKELKRRYEHEENLSPEERKEYREFLTTEEKREYRNLLTKVGEADGLFELAGCLQTQRKAVKEVSRELALGALDLGIVIGTMGLGSPYVAGRLALRLGSTVSKATQAKNLSKAKRLQSLGIFGTDVSFSSPYMQEAMEACEDSLNQLEEMQTEEQTANNKMCENLPIRAKQTSDLKSCILQASLASLPITLPILGLSGVALAKQLRNTPTGTPAPPISSAQQTAEVLEFPSPQKGISINSSGASSDEAVSFSVSEMNIVNRRMSRIQRRAGRELEEALQKIRNSPQESVLREQGFKPTYYRGLDQAREFNEVAKYLRTINADPEKTHIPYFADQVGKTITDFEKGLRQHNKNNPEFLGERLKILEDLKREARKRVTDQDVTYDWWSTFNLRLTMIASESNDFIENMLKTRNSNKLSEPDPLRTHEGTKELLDDFIRSVDRGESFLGDTAMNLIVLHSKKHFPKKIMFFTTDELGIMPFNKLENNSYFFGISGKPLSADGATMSAFSFLDHDLAHMRVVASRSEDRIDNEAHRKIIERIGNISSKPDREKAELVLFMYRHEGDINFIPAGKNAQEVKTELHHVDLYRFFNPDNLQGMLPNSVNVNDKEAVKKYLEESIDAFADILFPSLN